MPALVPATLAFDVSGAPYSETYGDIYHSTDGGIGQAQHVFLAGNGLPERWRNKEAFVIVETGFGFGLNFLTTWDVWKNDPQRCKTLHCISVEKHPFTREALATLHARYPLFAEQAGVLQSAWPTLTPGLHRREFENGRIVLTLAFGDVDDVLPKLRCVADALYLDGFAPEKNPDMWTARNMKALARISKIGTTFATYTAARSVRDALQNAGFAFEKRKGYGRKRDMLVGKYAPPPYEQKRRRNVFVPSEKRAVVIGAGLAGAGVAERLAARGWRVEVVEQHKTPAQETSGLHAGIFHPHISPDDALLSRLARAGFLYALDRWRNDQDRFSWSACGVLQIAKDDAEEARFAEIAQALRMPTDYATYVSRDAANENAGLDAVTSVSRGGWWFPNGGWVRARALIAAQLASPNVVTRFHTKVHALKYEENKMRAGWQVLAGNGDVLASAPVVILANAHDAQRLININAPMQSIRGQISLLDADAMPALKSVVCGDGYVLPNIAGVTVVGATYDTDDENAARAEDDASNLAQVKQLLPALSLEAGVLRGSQVGFRCVARDRMPVVGALPDIEAARAMQSELSGAHLPDLPRLLGLYGAFGYASRGLTWASLAGEVLASEINGEPLPIENDLLNAIDPGRFVLQQVRRGTL